MTVCDLDGDGLQDLMFVERTRLVIRYLDAQRGYPVQPDLTHDLGPEPCVVWTAHIGGPAGSVLVMTADGVTGLCFTNRPGPAVARQIIRQPTLVPEAATGGKEFFPLAVDRGRDRLLLLPATNGMQVWEQGPEWRLAQVLRPGIASRVSVAMANPGCTVRTDFDLSIADLNGDRREDVIVATSGAGWTNTFRVHLQLTNGLFALEPTLTYRDRYDWNSWLCWADLNRDGRVDLIKNVWLDEPSFMPGVPSAKVLVRTYVAGEQGAIPDNPQQIFRKKDWNPAVPVVDVDGDGYLDLVLGFSHSDTREGVRKQATAKELDYTLRFHFYRPGTGFPTESDCARDVVIKLDEPNVLLGSGPKHYFARFVTVDGDFNGDGRTDLLVRDRGNDISAYYFVSRTKGFSAKPDVRFNCPDLIEQWQAMDLNQDGVSDLLVTLADGKGYRVFISRK